MYEKQDNTFKMLGKQPKINAFIIFSTLAITTAVILILLCQYLIQNNLERIKNRDRHLVDLSTQTIASELSSTKADLSYLSQQPQTLSCLKNTNSNDCKFLAADYSIFSLHKKVYDPVRLLDKNGQELIRVNNNFGKPTVAEATELESKAGRYFVSAILEKNKGDIYVSPFDLSLDKGEVAHPIKPTIRFATPIVDNSGNKLGLVILNYLGQHLLDKLNLIPLKSLQDIWLVNGQGYWLQGPNMDENWGFMSPQHSTDKQFFTMYKDAWQAMQAPAPVGQFILKNELFTYSLISPDTAVSSEGGYTEDNALTREVAPNDPNKWFLIVYRPAKSLSSLSQDFIPSFLTIYIIALLIFASALIGMYHLTIKRIAAEKSLRISESRFKSLLISAPDPIIITDTEGKILYVNHQGEKLLGYDATELLSTPIEKLLPERFYNTHLDYRKDFAAASNTEKLFEEAYTIELSVLHKSNFEIPVAIRLSSIYTEEGTLIFSDIRDITQQKRSENHITELNQSLFLQNKELELTNQELEAFCYSVSHDLRAPLRAMDGFSQALQDDYGSVLESSAKDYLMRIRKSAQRMGILIDELLRLSRITRMGLKREVINLTDIAQEIVLAYQNLEPNRLIEYSIDPMMMVDADAKLLHIALENLIANALKFSSKKPRSYLKIGKLPEAQKAIYFIQDNGAGFDMAYAGKIFSAFQRLHDDRDFPGTGIGLAIVQRIIHKHGGEIWTESSPGQGAVFYFTL